LAGVYGHLTLNADGSYSYVADIAAAINSAPTGNHPQDTFTYTASDGNGGTAAASLTITLDRPAVVTASNQSVAAGTSIAGSSLFSVSDPDGAAITQYMLYDNSPDSSGYFVVNGVVQPLYQYVTLTAAQFAQTTFVAGTSGTTADLYAWAYDGVWDSAANFQIKSTPDTIAGGQTLELGSASAGSVTFTANTGTLKLDNSSSFTGTVAGLAGQDTLDLADINFATVQQPRFAGSSSGGTLTVTDGLHTANIALLGNYLSSSFVASNDGNGGTSIVDPPLGTAATDTAGSQGGINQNIALLSNYMASTFVPSGLGSGAPLAGGADAGSGQLPSLAPALSNQQQHG
jgi:VCBS repeat-containing protein